MTTQPTEGCRNLDLVWSPALTFEIRDVGGADPTQWPHQYTPPPFAIVYVVDRCGPGTVAGGRGSAVLHCKSVLRRVSSRFPSPCLAVLRVLLCSIACPISCNKDRLSAAKNQISALLSASWPMGVPSCGCREIARCREIDPGPLCCTSRIITLPHSLNPTDSLRPCRHAEPAPLHHYRGAQQAGLHGEERG